ncbi:MAG: hypothetical protein LBE31_01060 [Deltaproteobacteria bacterium]|jgi:hypothetical protein|nr:hypothetical protein [Deltaproteobacteria bacterium]
MSETNDKINPAATPQANIAAPPAAPEAYDLVVTPLAESSGPISLNELISQISSGLQLFVVALKNNGLYPSNSRIRKESFIRLYTWLNAFLEEHETLRLFVDPDILLFQGVVVHRDNPNEPNLIFPLFRDGLQWLEFHEGLSQEELEIFLGLLNRYRILREDDEDDLVTAMWGADFQSIKYKTANEFWDIDPVTEIAALTAGPGLSPGQSSAFALEQGTQGGPAGITALFELADNISSDDRRSRQVIPNLPDLQKLPGGPTTFTRGESLEAEDLKFFRSLELQDNDRKSLDDLLTKEGRALTLMESLEPVLDLLWRLRTLAQSQYILAFIAESVKFSLAAGAFTETKNLLARLSQITSRAAPRLEGVEADFYRRLSSYEILSGLALFKQSSTHNYQIEKEALALDDVLAVIPPQAIKDLAQVASEAAEPWVTTRLLYAIAARQEFVTPEIGTFINQTLKPHTLLELIDILKADTNRLNLLLTICQHMTTAIREAAAVTLLELDPNLISNLSFLLTEGSPGLSSKIFYLLGLKRSPVVEKAILNFLRSTYQASIIRSDDAIINAYRALGFSSTSEAAADFCTEVLNKKNLRALFGEGPNIELIHRTGSALALILMGREEQVARSANSFFKALRVASRGAEDEAAKVRRRIPQSDR